MAGKDAGTSRSAISTTPWNWTRMRTVRSPGASCGPPSRRSSPTCSRGSAGPPAGGRARAAPAPSGLKVDRHSDGAYAVLGFTLACTASPLLVDYALLFDLDATHRG